METDSAKLIDALRQPGAYNRRVESVELVETHISWLLLTGELVYKIKKPVDLGFVDFSTLEKRHHYCQEELRLNQRLAPQLYRRVVPITGTIAAPRVAGPGEPIEYAVEMRQFPADARLDRVLARGELTAAHIDEFAKSLAAFHRQTAIAEPSSPWGTPVEATRPMFDTLQGLLERVDDPTLKTRIESLARWAQEQGQMREPIFAHRRHTARIRECHGDLHLENLLLDDGQIVPFDCLEFSERLRWIDVISDVAFVTMDLQRRGRPDFAWRLLNAYLAESGDYDALHLLRFYQVYRALVRAKVAAIRAEQSRSTEEQQSCLAECTELVALAESLPVRRMGPLIITHGLSGSGKSHVTQGLLESLGAIRFRSDVERQRLFGEKVIFLRPSERAQHLYSPEANEATYRELFDRARQTLNLGYPVIVDATFLKRVERRLFHAFAEVFDWRLIVLDFRATFDLLQRRVDERLRAGIDASEATELVLRRQLAIDQSLTDDERLKAITIDAEHPPTPSDLAKEVLRLAAK